MQKGQPDVLAQIAEFFVRRVRPTPAGQERALGLPDSAWCFALKVADADGLAVLLLCLRLAVDITNSEQSHQYGSRASEITCEQQQQNPTTHNQITPQHHNKLSASTQTRRRNSRPGLQNSAQTTSEPQPHFKVAHRLCMCVPYTLFQP